MHTHSFVAPGWYRELPRPHRRVADGSSFAIEDVFKIPFLQALDLVRSRSVFLRGGFAYVPRDKLVSILAGKFRAYVRGQAAAPAGGARSGIASS